MGKSTIVPFGPQHPVLPEPIHLDLELKDEKVVKAIPSIGYIHRGLEKLVEKRGFQEYVYIAERVCGICSFGHGWGYSKAIEGLMGIEIPKRAEYLRTIWHEISRLHSHLLWAGLGDTYAKYFEATMSSRGDELAYYHALGVSVSRSCLEPLLRHLVLVLGLRLLHLLCQLFHWY